MFDPIPHILSLISPDMPAQGWWVALAILLILIATAVIDAATGKIPDMPIFLGMIFLIGAQGVLISWPASAQHLGMGLLAMIGIWAINEGWFRWFKRDALGMGDAKWTALAVAAFGLGPVLIGWGVGACLGSVWIIGVKVARRRVTHVHFAPFLCVGLLAGLYILRLRPEF